MGSNTWRPKLLGLDFVQEQWGTGKGVEAEEEYDQDEWNEYGIFIQWGEAEVEKRLESYGAETEPRKYTTPSKTTSLFL